jgi:hypothetical protein
MSGAIPPFPQYALMALCLVRAQGLLLLRSQIYSFMEVYYRENRTKNNSIIEFHTCFHYLVFVTIINLL